MNKSHIYDCIDDMTSQDEKIATDIRTTTLKAEGNNMQKERVIALAVRLFAIFQVGYGFRHASSLLPLTRYPFAAKYQLLHISPMPAAVLAGDISVMDLSSDHSFTAPSSLDATKLNSGLVAGIEIPRLLSS